MQNDPFPRRYLIIRDKIGNYFPLDQSDINYIHTLDDHHKMAIIQLFNECFNILVENLKYYL